MKVDNQPDSLSNLLSRLTETRLRETRELVSLFNKITSQEPKLWGPSIIGFGSKHYKYDSGREGDMPRLAFSPRKASITIYFSEGFDRYAEELKSLGKHRQSVSCLYINKLSDIDFKVLKKMLTNSYNLDSRNINKPKNVQEYISRVPDAAKPAFNKLRDIVKLILPDAKEVLSYGVVGYKVNEKMARVFISGWKDHLAIYPVPKDEKLKDELKPYIKGKGTLWFSLDEDLPTKLIEKVVRELVK